VNLDELFKDAEPSADTDLKMPMLALTENSALNIALAVQARARSGRGRQFVIDCKRAVKVTDKYIDTLIWCICRNEGVSVVFMNSFGLIRELGAKYSRMYDVDWLVEYA
jgi:hypothetical protein